MIERPTTHNQEATEQTANRYLVNLGLEWNDLRGKQVLDIGALNAEFESAARRRGVEVISVDKVADGEYMPPIDSKFVVANATKLPFKDESFDYALAHMSVMNYMEDDYKDEDHILYIEDVLRETCRILKPEGQFRFTDTALDDTDLRRGEDDVVPDRGSDTYKEWRMVREHQLLEEMTRRVGFRELQLKRYPESHPEKDVYVLSHYYTAIKGGSN